MLSIYILTYITFIHKKINNFCHLIFYYIKLYIINLLESFDILLFKKKFQCFYNNIYKSLYSLIKLFIIIKKRTN